MKTLPPDPSYLYPLFHHMQEEHKLTLLNCEMEEIIHIVEGLKKPAPVGEPLKEVLAALDQLLRVTVDNMLSDGIELTDEEAEARAGALAVFEKYGLSEEAFAAAVGVPPLAGPVVGICDFCGAQGVVVEGADCPPVAAGLAKCSRCMEGGAAQ